MVVTKPDCYVADSVVCDRSHLKNFPERSVVIKIESMKITNATTIWRPMISGNALNRELTAILSPSYR